MQELQHGLGIMVRQHPGDGFAPQLLLLRLVQNLPNGREAEFQAERLCRLQEEAVQRRDAKPMELAGQQP